MDLKDKTVLITGGHGFLGSHLQDALRAEIQVEEYNGLNKVKKGVAYTFRSELADLTNYDQTIWLMKKIRPDVVIHLAAVVGGIGANQKKPGTFFFKNMQMGLNIIEASNIYNVKKTVLIGTVCSYPKITPVPFKEADIWNGYPEETNAPYGIAKKAMLTMAKAYHDEYGFKYAYIIPVNLYGPRDNFDLDTSHVIPAIIRKCAEAKKYKDKKITLWGSGKATREFLYARDCANAIIYATKFYSGTEPVNVGTGKEISISDLAQKIADKTRYNGIIEWDSEKPDGQPRRSLDITNADRLFSFIAKTSLDKGLDETIDWYNQEI